MTFEEDFPSLYKGVEHICTDESCESFCWFTIAYCCFDKVRVKEVIDKLMNEYQEYDGEYAGMLDGDDLLKELGLEKRKKRLQLS